MEASLAFLVMVIAAIFYFVPTMIGSLRHVEHRSAIFFVNLLLGWTIFGWFAVFVWAVVERPQDIKENRASEPEPRRVINLR